MNSQAATKIDGTSLLGAGPSKRLDQYERASLRQSLYAWGRWADRDQEHSGYPSADSVERFLQGSGGRVDGHRVLCLDWPEDVYATHQRVLRLSVELQRVIGSIYSGIMMPDGNVLPWSSRAARIHMSESTLRRSHERALLLIAGLDADSRTR